MSWRPVALASSLLLGAASFAQDAPRDPNRENFWFVSAGTGFGQPVLGSEDIRRGGIYTVGLAMPWNGLKLFGHPGQFVAQGYYMFTKGGGFEDIPVNGLHTYGVLASARYHNHWFKGVDTFFEVGWGFCYSNHSTRDLDSLINSTPTFGIGASWAKGNDLVFAQIRWWHMSNGGTDGNNQGLNQIQYIVGVKF